MSELNVEEVVKLLNLKPHPEGGYFLETFRSELNVKVPGLSDEKMMEYSAGTAIFYLITEESYSNMHRIKNEEIFHFYMGDSVEMIQINPSGRLIKYKIGSRIELGELPQVVVPQDYWQGAKVMEGGKWTLLGTTVSPGFEFKDFELADKEKLTKQFPQHKSEIERFIS